MLFFVVCFSYLSLVLEPLNWLVLAPSLTLRPNRRSHLIGGWLKFQTRVVLTLARILAGLRFEMHGAIEPTSSIVVMNHQSVFDILVGLSLIGGPYPLIPTRASYGFGIPGISSLIKLMRCPLVTQQAVIPRSQLRALLDAAGQVARGEQSLLIYPEGHRSRNGSIQPFMKPGLRLFLSRARERPVYVAVVDGLGHLRTFADTALRVAGSIGRVQVRGPYNTPPEDVELDGFIDSLRDQMVGILAELRRGDPELAARDSGGIPLP